MKKIYLFFVLCFALIFHACDDTEDVRPVDRISQDKINPVVKIDGPVANESIVIVSGIKIKATVTDNQHINRVRFLLSDTKGSNYVVSEIMFNGAIGKKEYTVDGFHSIPKFTLPGEYTFTVEARDGNRNISQSTVNVTLHAPTLDRSTFGTPFVSSFFNEHLLEALDWFGYNHNDRGLAFDADWLSTLFYFMIDTESGPGITKSEWSNFVRDFDVQHQSWPKWDQDEDGTLGFEEFVAGIKRLDYMTEWDKNKDKHIDPSELAAGIFTRWDHNRDNVLSQEEYLNNFYTYLYSKRPSL